MSAKRSGKVNEQQANGRKRRKPNAAASEAISVAGGKDEPAATVIVPDPIVTPSPLQEAIKSEFVCTVCLDIAIKAHGLSCSHLFCEYCIKHWLEKNTKCPFCREDTRCNRPVPISAVDRVIEKYFESQPECAKDERNKNVEERAKMVTEMLAARPPRPPRLMRHRIGGFESDSEESDFSVDSSEWDRAHNLFSNIQGYFDDAQSEDDSDFSLDSYSSAEDMPPLEDASDLEEDSNDDSDLSSSEEEALAVPVGRRENNSPHMVVGVYRANSSRSLQEVIMDSLRMFRRDRTNTDGRSGGERDNVSNRSNNNSNENASSARSRASSRRNRAAVTEEPNREENNSPTNVVELPTLRRSQRNRPSGRRDGAASRRGFN